MQESRNLSMKDVQLLNTNKAIKQMLLVDGTIHPLKVKNYVKYEREVERMQIELIKLQTWVITNKKRICILFEGRDAAGKGGAIRRMTHHMNPRHYRAVALPKPTKQEQGQWYFQRYINQLPNPGEIVFFDRSWYNRAVVEPVNKFCTEEEYLRFMNEVNQFEEMITNDGIILIKFYISINKPEQARRFKDIASNPLKRWKMTPVDEKAQELWNEYTHYKQKMFEQTDTAHAPWIILKANKKTKARLKAMSIVLNKVPYE